MSLVAVAANVYNGAMKLAELFPQGSGETVATATHSRTQVSTVSGITTAANTPAAPVADLWAVLPSVPGVPEIMQRPVKMALVFGLGAVAAVGLWKRLF